MDHSPSEARAQDAPHVVVVGAGAVGLLYGGWLLAGGGRVSFIARGKALSTLRTRGLELRGAAGTYRCPSVSAAERIADLPQADVIVLAVKLYDLEEAARLSAGGLAPGGLVVGLQNGVEAAGVLAEVFGPERVMTGPVYSACTLIEPGIVAYSGKRNLVAIGGGDDQARRMADRIANVWRNAGVEVTLAEDIRTVLWTKFMGFATNAALTCLTRRAAGLIYNDPDLTELAQRSIHEIIEVARAEGVALPSTAVEDTLALLRSFPADMVASMRQDLDAGRRLELDGVSGAIRRLGRLHGVPTPFHDTAFACLKPFRDGAHVRDLEPAR